MATAVDTALLTALLVWASTAQRELSPRVRLGWAAAAGAAGTVPGVLLSTGHVLVPLSVMLIPLIVAAIVDAHQKVIPNLVSLAASVLAVVCWVNEGAPGVAMLFTVALSLLLVAVYVSGAQLGAGDVKLLPAVLLAAMSTVDPDLGPAAAALVGSVFMALSGVGVLAWQAAAHVHRTRGRVWRLRPRHVARAAEEQEPAAPGMLAGAGALLTAAGWLPVLVY